MVSFAKVPLWHIHLSHSHVFTSPHLQLSQNQPFRLVFEMGGNHQSSTQLLRSFLTGEAVAFQAMSTLMSLDLKGTWWEGACSSSVHPRLLISGGSLSPFIAVWAGMKWAASLRDCAAPNMKVHFRGPEKMHSKATCFT